MPVRPFALVIALAALGGCATGKSQQRLLDETLDAYGEVIRWGNFEQALSFVDPEVLKKHPVSALDLQRYQQVRVTIYNDQPPRPAGPDDVTQLVEIGLVNVNTQTARSLVDNQRWHWDDKARHWWLESGLPDITSH